MKYVKNLTRVEKQIYMVAYRLKRDGLDYQADKVAEVLNIEENKVKTTLTKIDVLE